MALERCFISPKEWANITRSLPAEWARSFARTHSTGHLCAPGEMRPFGPQLNARAMKKLRSLAEKEDFDML